MRLVVFSYKSCWQSPDSPSGYATDGGFPFQMAALSELFASTTLVLPHPSTPPPDGLRALAGRQLSVRPLPEPAGQDLRRKVALLAWLPRHLPALLRAVREADAVHAVVPGDIGSVGIVLAVLSRQPLLVRHCGTWGRPVTFADRLLHRGLVRIAGGQRVVLATGGGAAPPEPRNAAISWIFSTTLTTAELEALPAAPPWTPGDAPRLVTVGRLTRGKNTSAVVRALATLRSKHPEAALDVVGHGPEMASLRALAEELGLAGAVTFHGNLPHGEVLSRLSAAHLLVFPTRVAEGFPKAVLEAMACGVPVLAPRVSVLPRLLGDGRGFLLDDTTPEALVGAVGRLLERPSALAEAAVASRGYVRRFTLEGWRDEIRERLKEAWGLSAAA